MQMELDVFDRYIEAIEIVRARENIVELNLIAYPHAKKNHQDKIFKELKRLARPRADDTKILSTEDLARIIGGERG